MLGSSKTDDDDEIDLEKIYKTINNQQSTFILYLLYYVFMLRMI